MITRKIILIWLVTFVFVMGANAIFHALLAPYLFNDNLVGDALPMNKINPISPIIINIITVSGMVYLTLNRQEKPNKKDAVIIGMFLGLLTDSTWHILNLGLFPDWSITVAIWDTTWHIMLGFFGGLILINAYNRYNRYFNKPNNLG